MSHRHRRIHPGVPGDRRCRLDPLRPRHRGPRPAYLPARCTAPLRSENGPEFVSQAILERPAKEKIETAHIDPGKPWQNADNEGFNGKFRDERLSLEWFRSRAEAKVVIETWRRHYNEVRPHSSLDELTPIEFKTRYHSTNPGAVPQF